MAEYYAVLKKAVGGLAADSSDARRAVYEKARNALIGQLKAIDPPLTTSEISRQRLELEEAIRRVEREAGANYASPPPAAPAQPQYQPEPVNPDDLDFDLELEAPPEQGRGRRQNVLQEAFQQAVQVAERQSPSPRAERREAPVPQARAPSRGRQEPSFDTVRAPDVRGRGGDISADTEPPPDDRRGKKRGRREREEAYEEAPPRRGSRLPSIILTVVILAVLGGLGALAWSQRDFLSDVIASLRSPSEGGPAPEETSPPAEETARAPDATVRDVGEGAGISGPAESGAPPQPSDAVPLAQRAILYEESRAKPGDVVASLDGAVTWKYLPSGPNGPVIEADLSIPERSLKIVMTIRKNLDVEMPASHLVEIKTEASTLPGGGIEAIPRLVMKPAEEQKGQPLAGTPTKVIDGLYWIALAGGNEAAQANVAIMRQSNWFDLPLLYKSGQRAILTFEKGQPGKDAFDKAFAAWGN